MFFPGTRAWTVFTAAAAISAACFMTCAAAGGDAVVYYDFSRVEDGQLKDLSGKGYHAEVKGQPSRARGGLRFGDGTCLIIPAVSAMDVGDGGFSVELEFELEPDNPLKGAAILIEGKYKDHPRAWMIMLNEDLELFFNVRGPRGDWNAARLVGPVPAGEPVHIVAVFERDPAPMWDTMIRRLYLNGKPQPHLARGSAAGLVDNEKIIVGALEPGRLHFRGILRQLRLYPRGLSDEDEPAFVRGRRLRE